MKVAIIDVNYTRSSTGKIVNSLHTFLTNNNVESRVYYGRGKKIHGKNICKFGIDLETYFHALMTRITGLTGYFSLFSTLKLLIALEKFRPDIVHIHELHAYFVNIELLILYLKRKKFPIVWTFHCEFMYTGKCGLAGSCVRWQANCGMCPQKNKYPKSIFFDFTAFMHRRKKKIFSDMNSLTIVTPSIWLAQRVKMSFLHKKELRIINNGIDLDVFTSELRDTNKCSYKFTFVSIAPGIMSEEKGGEWVLRLAEKIDNKLVRFILVGDTKKCKTELPNVQILPKIFNQKKIAEYYCNADIFLIFSKKENFPTTVIESLSCGTPVVGFKNGGAEEIIDTSNGILFEQNDVDGVVNFLNSFIDGLVKFDTRKAIADYAKSRFDERVMGKNYYELYKEVITNGNKK